MLLICKAVLLLVFELIIEYIFGTMLTKWILKKEVHPLMSLLMGFMAYQAVFQVVSLTVTLTTRALHHATIAWCIIVVLLTCCGVVLNRSTMIGQVKYILLGIRGHKYAVACSAVVVLLFCYYVAINGESNEDARYYIGLMTTSVDTDSLFCYNVYNGYHGEALYLRRALTTFEIHGAVLSQITGIHPLVIARIFRACQNVILTSAAVFLCGKSVLWRKDEQAVEKSLFTVAIFLLMQPTFVNTIYTPATFLLFRAYEAKAFTANMIVLLGLYLCVEWMHNKKFGNMILIGLYLWGSIAISTSAFLVAGAECAILILPVWIMGMIAKKKQERLHAS